MKINENMIADVFERVISQMSPENNFERYFISGGGKPLASARAEQNARNVFNIPDDVRVYFVTSANLFGGIKIGGKGFAITTNGIYYTDDTKNRGIITIQEFINARICESPYITINNHRFNATNKENLLKMLIDLKKELAKCLNDTDGSEAKNTETFTTVKQEIETFDYLTEYYEESVFHILNAKDYFYEIIGRLRDSCDNFRMYSRAADRSITKEDYNKVIKLYNKFKSYKSKFENVYGISKIDLIKVMKKGIYFEQLDNNGKIVDYGGDTEAIISYISDNDLDFKGTVKKRINRISKFSYENRDEYDNSPFLNSFFWNAAYTDVRDLTDSHSFDSEELEDLIDYLTDLIDELYHYR